MCYQKQLFENLVDICFTNKKYFESNKEDLLEKLVEVYSQRLTVDISFSYICA